METLPTYVQLMIATALACLLLGLSRVRMLGTIVQWLVLLLGLGALGFVIFFVGIGLLAAQVVK